MPGRPPFGILGEAVGAIERDAFQLKNPMGGKANWLAQRFGFKHFQYIGAVSDQLFVGCAVADLGIMANVFVYVFDPQSKKMQRVGWESFLGKGYRYNPNPDDGVSDFHSQHGSVIMSAQKDPANGRQTKRLQVDLKSGLQIDLSFDDSPPYEPMRICTQTGATGWTYAQKVAGIPALGSVQSKLGTFDLAAIDSYAHHDFTAGYLRRNTYWHWACFSGKTKDGLAIGLNLSNGVNETGVTENCLWIDGTMHKIDTAMFDFDGDDLYKQWTITSFDQQIDLSFTPMGSYSTKRNAFVSAVNFHQMFGQFNGVIHQPNGDIVIDKVNGFAERQYAKW